VRGLFSVIFVVFVLIVAIALGSQNDGVITINYLIAKTTLTISSLIAITVGLGVLLGIAIMVPLLLRLNVLLALQKRKNQ
jgi:putative membrane protein